MKDLLLMLGIIAFFFFAAVNAAPASITFEQYGLGSGFLHGFAWWLLWIMQLLGRGIYIIADNHTFMYMVGFVIGCLSSPAVIGIIIYSIVTITESFRR